jgi:hypothetical protein
MGMVLKFTNSINHIERMGHLAHSKVLRGFFLCIFSSLTCLKKTVFSKPDLLQWKVPASLSLFLKSEKIPALLYAGKGPLLRPFSYTEYPLAGQFVVQGAKTMLSGMPTLLLVGSLRP